MTISPTGAQVRGSTPLQREWVDYSALASISKGENPFSFWSTHAKHLPVLAKVARRILCVPATSSQVERDSFLQVEGSAILTGLD